MLVEVNKLVTNKLHYQIMKNINEKENQPSCLGDVMSRFVYRLYERGKCRTYEIGELDSPRTSPKEWCDRRLCEGFWGDEESCKKVVYLLNNHITPTLDPY